MYIYRCMYHRYRAEFVNRRSSYSQIQRERENRNKGVIERGQRNYNHGYSYSQQLTGSGGIRVIGLTALIFLPTIAACMVKRKRVFRMRMDHVLIVNFFYYTIVIGRVVVHLPSLAVIWVHLQFIQHIAAAWEWYYKRCACTLQELRACVYVSRVRKI